MTKRQKDNMTKRQHDKKDKGTKKTKGQKDKKKKDKRQRLKREFNIVMSGQFRTLAMFFTYCDWILDSFS